METDEKINDTGFVKVKRKKKITPEQKWQIFLETSKTNAPIGEILRRWGLYSSELTKIRKQAEEGALQEFGKNRHKKKESVPYQNYVRLEAELQAKEKALAQMGEEYLILKKRVS